MKERSSYLFLAEQREAKPAQFTGRLDRLSALGDWQGLARVVNDATGREGALVKSAPRIILRACVNNLRRWETIDRRGACGA